MSIPPLIGYYLTAPGGKWWFVHLPDEVETLRKGHPERTAQAVVTFTACRGALLATRAQLCAQHALAMSQAQAEAETLLASMAGELERLRARLPG